MERPRAGSAEARRRRSEAVQRLAQAEPAREEPASSNGQHEAALVRAALAAQPERRRLALFLRYYADLDYAGIAEAPGITCGTVSATLHAAHANLQTPTEVDR